MALTGIIITRAIRRVLVDLGHHALNIELLWHFSLAKQTGWFHFNNHKYADDDLTVGSINPNCF